ncbi:MAG: hypothetical protein I8H91_01625 [Burkholderiales bacterium]|nr:hypothetical protein [Burkholderiales bacterium]
MAIALLLMKHGSSPATLAKATKNAAYPLFLSISYELHAEAEGVYGIFRC